MVNVEVFPSPCRHQSYNHVFHKVVNLAPCLLVNVHWYFWKQGLRKNVPILNTHILLPFM